MPVTKYRTFEEAARSGWLEPGDPRIWAAFVRRSQLHAFFSRRPRPVLVRGVFRYRSIEEKQAGEARE